MFISLGIIFFVGFLGGWLFEKIRLPKLIFYLLLGILISPSVLNLVDESLLSISASLRQIALIIILTRSGLSLDIKKLKSIGRPALLMCFIPASFEILGVLIFGPMLLNISWTEALLLGSVLGAVSPAIVVPRMIKLQQRKIGDAHHIPELIMVGASCDDIYVIVLFYAFKGLVTTNQFSFEKILEIPISIILGLLLGVLMSILLVQLFKRIRLTSISKTLIFLGISFLMVGLETLIEEYISISSLLGIMLMGILILKYSREDAKAIEKNYQNLWSGFEILLFVLVGCAVDIQYAFSETGGMIIGVLLLALCFRTLGVTLSLLCTKFTFKEKIYIVISYLPKATVQASIGGIALSEGLACGTLILTAAVLSILIAAPLGAILMDTLDKKLLNRSDPFVKKEE